MRIALSILMMLWSVSLFASQIVVCKSCQISSIKKAIEVANNGDEIIVKSGVYKEHGIEISKSLTLSGDGLPVVDGEMVGTIFTVSADSFSFSGFKLINVGQSYTKDFAAILLHKVDYFSIFNNRLENVFFGILIEKSHHGEVYGNIVSGERLKEANSGNGIHIWHSSDVKVFQNEVFGMRDGIYFEFVDQSSIYENHSHNNIRYGLHFMFSNDDVYHHNEFRDNGAGVAVMFSKKIEMHHNKFMFNWGSASYGLLLKEIYDAEIYHNIFEQNTVGVTGDGSTRINFYNNHFERNGWAVKITGGCYDNIFKDNNFTNNSFDLAFNGHLNGSAFHGNYWSEYTGYDLDKNQIGDVPYRPVKLFSYVVNKTPETIILLRSLFVDIINFSEKVSPVFTPDDLLDNTPLMKPAKTYYP